MKKIRALGLAVLMAIVLCACGEEQELADISIAEGDGYTAIIWEERTYVPYCAVLKKDCGALIGYVDGNANDRVCEYKDYPSNEWIANYLRRRLRNERKWNWSNRIFDGRIRCRKDTEEHGRKEFYKWSDTKFPRECFGKEFI